MVEPMLPVQLVEARRTPLFDVTTLPDALATSHRTTVWAEIRVEAGPVRYVDLEGDERRDERLNAGESAVIAPGIDITSSRRPTPSSTCSSSANQTRRSCPARS